MRPDDRQANKQVWLYSLSSKPDSSSPAKQVLVLSLLDYLTDHGQLQAVSQPQVSDGVYKLVLVRPFLRVERLG
jgi:hypothetical protein